MISPHKAVGFVPNKLFWPTIASAVTMLLTSCSPVNSVAPFDRQQAALLIKQNTHFVPTREWINIQLPQPSHWQRINKSFGTADSPIMYIPHDGDMNNPIESVQTDLRSYIYYPHMTAKIMVEKHAARNKQQCQTIRLQTLQETARSLTYRLIRGQCRGQDNTIEIGKAFNGADAVYVVYYIANSDNVPATRIKQMTNTIAVSTRYPQNPYRK